MIAAPTIAPGIHPATRLGAVELTISNLERSLSFYQRVLGFQVHDRSDGVARLGAGGAALLTLVEQPGARAVRNHTGLYHFAILTPSRHALAQSLRNLIATGAEIGGSDHVFSEALYLSDPDGNGIEVYRDRPRDTWTWQHGQIMSGSFPLDYPNILAELKHNPAPWQGLHADTVLGHMHVHVANLEQTARFYRDILGFELTINYGGAALFFAAGGYHHHIGTNTWAGVGAPPPPSNAVGLRHYEVVLPTAQERARLIDRLEAADVPYEQRADGMLVRDPAQNGMLFVVNQPA